SFVLGANLPQTIGLEIVLDLASASPSLPAWWDLFNAGACRQSSLSADFIAADPLCPDWAHGQSLGGLASYCTLAGQCSDHPTDPNLARIKVAVAVAPNFARDLTAGTEYFGFNMGIDFATTVGPGSCGGCTIPVCIVLNSINVVQKGGLHAQTLTTGTGPGSNFVAWQGGGMPSGHGLTGCPAATATRRPTWGALKSLYR